MVTVGHGRTRSDTEFLPNLFMCAYNESLNASMFDVTRYPSEVKVSNLTGPVLALGLPSGAPVTRAAVTATQRTRKHEGEHARALNVARPLRTPHTGGKILRFE